MNTFVDPNDFPAAKKYTYLNAAPVAMMHKDIASAVIDWQEDLHKAAARLFNTQAENIEKALEEIGKSLK